MAASRQTFICPGARVPGEHLYHPRERLTVQLNIKKVHLAMTPEVRHFITEVLRVR
jgi:hypothetical protein